MNLTVVCLWVQGPYPYTADYVRRLSRMVHRNLKRPFRFVCMTDKPWELEDIETIPIQGLAGIVPRNGEGFWTKVRLFDHKHGLTHGRILYLDLDTLVVSALDPIVDFPAPFALTTDALVEERAHLNTDRFGRALVRRFNSSVMVWNGGTQLGLYDRWTPEDALRLSTDQDWIAEQAPEAKGMPLAWFPRISQLVKDPQFAETGAPFPPEATVVLTKKPKNHICVERWPWFEPLWGAPCAR
jgi:hypothetical protein